MKAHEFNRLIGVLVLGFLIGTGITPVHAEDPMVVTGETRVSGSLRDFPTPTRVILTPDLFIHLMNSTIHFMKMPTPTIVPLLRSQTQGIILAAILSEPELEFSLSDLAVKASRSQPTIWREIDRAQKSGLVTTRKVGNSILVRADQSSRYLKPIREIVVAAFGAPAIVAQEFADVHGVEALILFGSWAARFKGVEGRSPNDLDILVLGKPNRTEIHHVGDRIETKLKLPIQITVRSLQQWNDPDPFLIEVKDRPLLVLSTNSKTKDLEKILEQSRVKK